MDEKILKAESDEPRERLAIVSTLCASPIAADHKTCAGCACTCRHPGWRVIRSKDPMRGVYLNVR